jgi:hypothetical protein
MEMASSSVTRVQKNDDGFLRRSLRHFFLDPPQSQSKKLGLVIIMALWGRVDFWELAHRLSGESSLQSFRSNKGPRPLACGGCKSCRADFLPSLPPPPNMHLPL